MIVSGMRSEGGRHRSRVRSPGSRLCAALGIAAGGHLALMGLLAVSVPRRTPPPLPDPEADAVQAAVVSSADLPADLPPLDSKQVIRTLATSDRPPPEDTPYIAEHDADVDRQTRAERSPQEPEPQLGARLTGGDETQQPAAEPAPQPAPRPERMSGQVLPEVPQAQTVPARSAPTETENAVDRRTAERSTTAAAAGPTPEPGLPSPLVSLGVGGNTDDHLPELPRGAVTAVDARASALAAYLNGLRLRIRPRFRPRQVYEKLDPQHRIPHDVLAITIDVRLLPDGRVDRAEVRRSSGLPPLDHEAVAAFARAEPFQPPGATLLDTRGGLDFSFEFILHLKLDRFRVVARERLAQHWKPSRAFRQGGDRERVTVARLLLRPDGGLAHAAVVGPAGIGFLDEGVLEGLRSDALDLPRPPNDYGLVAGLVPVWVEFHHRVRADPEIRVLAPAEKPKLLSSGR